MRVAVIDLGTNTFNLLIADVSGDKVKVLCNFKEGVALGMGGINEKIIDVAAQERAFRAFEDFKVICDQYHVEKAIGIATSAVRDATNGAVFSQAISDKFGIPISIIDGLKEAELIYKGVNCSYDFPNSSVIMDIGGGSTEFIRVEHQEITDSCSLNIGVSRAYQLFQFNDPLTSADEKVLRNWFEQESGALASFNAVHTLVGASGSFETFFEMTHSRTFPEGLAPQKISVSELNRVLDWIIGSTLEERENHQFILPIRRKMAPIAAVKTKWILERLEIQELVISPCSLKEGVLYELGANKWV